MAFNSYWFVYSWVLFLIAVIELAHQTWLLTPIGLFFSWDFSPSLPEEEVGMELGVKSPSLVRAEWQLLFFPVQGDVDLADCSMPPEPAATAYANTHHRILTL